MINRIILTGRMTNDIDLRTTDDGLSFGYFTLAVKRNIGKNITDFIPCVAWRQTAEFLQSYAKKGSLIGVEGRLEVYQQEQNGNYQTRINVNVSQVHFLESKKNSQDERQENLDLKFNKNENLETDFKKEKSENKKKKIDFDEIDFDEIDF